MIGLAQLALTAALAVSPASAGAGIQAGPVCLPTTAHPGTSYALGTVEVQNTGSGDENLSLQVHPQPAGPGFLPGKTVPASWARFTYPRGWWGMTSESSVHLSPGATAFVPGRLDVPRDAAPGTYVSWIEVSLAGAGTPGGHLNLGAAAATPLEFQVTGARTAAQHAGCITLRSAPPAHHAARKGRRHPAAATPAAPQPIRLNGNEEAAVAGVILVAVGAVVLWLRRRA